MPVEQNYNANIDYLDVLPSPLPEDVWYVFVPEGRLIRYGSRFLCDESGRVFITKNERLWKQENDEDLGIITVVRVKDATKCHIITERPLITESGKVLG